MEARGPKEVGEWGNVKEEEETPLMALLDNLVIFKQHQTPVTTPPHLFLQQKAANRELNV